MFNISAAHLSNTFNSKSMWPFTATNINITKVQLQIDFTKSISQCITKNTKWKRVSFKGYLYSYTKLSIFTGGSWSECFHPTTGPFQITKSSSEWEYEFKKLYIWSGGRETSCSLGYSMGLILDRIHESSNRAVTLAHGQQIPLITFSLKLVLSTPQPRRVLLALYNFCSYFEGVISMNMLKHQPDRQLGKQTKKPQ